LDRFGYLGYYREYWNCLLGPDDHIHESWEDRSECYNCIMGGLVEKMSAFELACWNWYAENVTPFTSEHGIVRDLFMAEGLTGKAKGMFLKALGAIHQTFETIRAEMLKQKKAEA
jgi:hypothetical protein